jgi:hypothetical protein
MLQNVRSDNKPLTDEELSHLVVKVRMAGLSLPTSYLDFMQKYNGGRPNPAIFPIEGLPGNPDGAIQVFFGIGDTVASVDLVNVLKNLPDTVPTGLFPIACTDGGDYICIDLRKIGSPVVYWDRREFWGDGVWKERYLFPIAPGFDELLDALHNND